MMAPFFNTTVSPCFSVCLLATPETSLSSLCSFVVCKSLLASTCLATGQSALLLTSGSNTYVQCAKIAPQQVWVICRHTSWHHVHSAFQGQKWEWNLMEFQVLVSCCVGPLKPGSSARAACDLTHFSSPSRVVWNIFSLQMLWKLITHVYLGKPKMLWSEILVLLIRKNVFVICNIVFQLYVLHFMFANLFWCFEIGSPSLALPDLVLVMYFRLSLNSRKFYALAPEHWDCRHVLPLLAEMLSL